VSKIAMWLLRINLAGSLSTSVFPLSPSFESALGNHSSCLIRLAHALLLATRFSEYAPVLREGVGDIVVKEGWTKAAASKMFKLDSFLREARVPLGLVPVSSSFPPPHWDDYYCRHFHSDAPPKSDGPCRVHILRWRHCAIRLLDLRIVVYHPPPGRQL
jgi:hypothetical protein